MVDLSNENGPHIFVPFAESNAHVSDADKLQSIFAGDGYVFLRGLVAQEAARLRGDIIGVLKRHEYVRADATDVPIWSGKWPEGNEGLQLGGIAGEISELQSITELSGARPLIELLERLLGGEIFNFVENMDRIRHIFPNRQALELIERGEPVPDATPAHQDDSFYGIPFVSVWIALTEIDEAVGGLALRQGSHKLGELQHWWEGPEMLGVAETATQANEWSQRQASVTWGDVAADNSPKVWLRSNYRPGDVLIFHPLMVHRGYPNVSDKIRLSSDFRYQRQGDPEVWWIRHRLAYRRKFVRQATEVLKRANLDETLYNRVYAALREEGPPPGGSDEAVMRRVRELARELSSETS